MPDAGKILMRIWASLNNMTVAGTKRHGRFSGFLFYQIVALEWNCQVEVE